jgi:serine protease AprX
MTKISAIALLALGLGCQAQAGEVLRSKAVGNFKPSRLTAAALPEGNGLFLVQWKQSPTEREKAQIAALGLNLLSYYPDDAFIAQGSGSAAKAAQGLSFLNAVVAYAPAMRMEQELTQHGALSFNEAMRVTVQLAPGADEKAVRAALVNPTNVDSNLVVGSATVGALWQLAARNDVLWIERYLDMRTFDVKASDLGVGAESISDPTRTGYESGVKVLNVDSFYALGMMGQGQVVAVADTGLDTGDVNTMSADFQGQLKIGIAIGLGGHSWGDPEMHGTHVSGSILGNGRNSNNLIRGGAYGSQLVMLGMWSDIMNNIMPPTLDKLYQAAYDNGARIQSNSWGAPNSLGRYDAWAALTDQFMFNHPDFLAMFAAGNDGADTNKDGVIDEGSVGSPGTAKNVLTVGASKNLLLEGGIQRQMKDLRNGAVKWGVEPLASSKLSEDLNGLAAFSSRGPTADHRLKPEIVAPGTNIVSVRDQHVGVDPATMSWGIYDDNYVYMGGTSMATPVAAGAVALTRQFLMKQLNATTVSSALLKATVANSADDLFPGQFGTRSAGQEEPTMRPNNHEGWGRVNLANLVGSRKFVFADEMTGLATGQQKSVTFSHDGSGPLRVTMAYTDAPGAASAEKTLVNDLDLTVVDASGHTYYPNNGSGKDSTNNMEQVDLNAAAAGTYTITVSGASVPQGKNGAQPYALVISSGK